MTKALEQVFNKFLENKPIFTNRDALTISYTPESIPHRENQINDLGRIVAVALKGGKPSNIFVYGRTGTGKSLVSRLVCKELEKISRGNGNPVKIIYVNCKMRKQADTEYRLLASLSKEFGEIVPFTGLPTDQVYNRFFGALEKSKTTVILIIDEIDVLIKKNGDEILYNLTRINQDLKNSKLSIIGITNDLGFIESLDPRVKSSLSEEELIFPPYNALELKNILKTRSLIAFNSDVLGDGVVEKCAALAAQEHGDARRALDLLRVSGELAERYADEKITIKHVDIAEEKIDLDRIVETVKTQPKQSQIVLHSIMSLDEKNKEIQTGDVFDIYQDICKKHGLKPLTQRRISDLIAELDLFGIITTKVVSKGRYGRSRIINMNLSNQIKNKLKNLLNEIFL
ncbi:MAG: ORC1-type DNA replication protein [Candidatus Hodarchaeales archaeon]|jgi:cell division control protein 6